MHKNNLVLLLLQVSSLVYGAASSSSDMSPDRYKVETEFLLGDEIVDIGLAHLPAEVHDLVADIASGIIKSGTFLFKGPPGMAKTASAKCIAQRYYDEENRHIFHGASLVGDQYQNSGVMVLQQNMAPIIQRAKRAPQIVIVDEFQSVFRKQKQESKEKKHAETELLKLFDAMKATEKVVFIGTCNKISGLSAPIKSRFDEWFAFERIPKEFYSAALQFHLNRTEFPTTVTTPADLEIIVNECSFELRAVESIVKLAIRRASKRARLVASTGSEQSLVITKADLLQAIATYKRKHAPQPVSWWKWAKKHNSEIMMGVAVAGIVAIGVGFWVQYKYRQEDMANQKALRLDDIARQDTIHGDDVARQLRLHNEQIEQTKASAALQLAHATDLENARLRRDADYNGLSLPFTRGAFYQLSPEQQQLCLVERENRIRQQYGNIGLWGERKVNRFYEALGYMINDPKVDLVERENEVSEQDNQTPGALKILWTVVTVLAALI